MSYSIGFIGAGKVATLLAPAFQLAGHRIDQVISRSAISAERLGHQLHCRNSNQIADLDLELEILFLTVPDEALPELIHDISHFRGLVIHTSGSFSPAHFACQKYPYGYLYPLQTFTIGRQVNLSEIPVFIEGSDPTSEGIIRQLAMCLTDKVFKISPEDKLRLHLAAVWACNFTNHLLAIALKLMDEKGLPREWLYPVIRETFEKALALSPERSQTGPAVRQDETTIRSQLQQLSSKPEWFDLYRLLNQSIISIVKSNSAGEL